MSASRTPTKATCSRCCRCRPPSIGSAPTRSAATRFARAIYGAQVSLTVALGSVGIGLTFGGTLGLVGGYFGRWPDRLIMGTMTVLLCFPGIILAIALVSSLGPSVGNVTFAIGVIFIPAFARIARANTLEPAQPRVRAGRAVARRETAAHPRRARFCRT